MARYWATADARTVRVYKDGLVVAYRRGDFSGTKREAPPASAYSPPKGARPIGGGINPDEVDHVIEEMGFVAASTGSWKWVEEQGYYRFQVAPEAAFMARQPKPVEEAADVVRLKNISAIGHPEGMAGLRREGSVSKAEITAARAELRRRGLRS